MQYTFAFQGFLIHYVSHKLASEYDRNIYSQLLSYRRHPILHGFLAFLVRHEKRLTPF